MCKAVSSAGGVEGWVGSGEVPQGDEKVIQMKISLGTWKGCSITTDGKKGQYPIIWNRLKCNSSQV